jgi:CRP-like cAMP-binding protein
VSAPANAGKGGNQEPDLDILRQLFSWDALPGHIGFAIIAISYLLTNIFWLRLAAVVGIGGDLIYSLASTPPDWTSSFWDTVFILINLAQLFRLLRDRISLRLSLDERAFLAPIVGRLDKAQIAQLLRTAEWRTLQPGEVLTVENTQVKDLTFICSGSTEVRAKGQLVAHIGPGAFVGDVSFTTGVLATATVMVDEEARVLAFDQIRLKALCVRDQQIASALYQRIGGGLADKMRVTTDRLQ